MRAILAGVVLVAALFSTAPQSAHAEDVRDDDGIGALSEPPAADDDAPILVSRSQLRAARLSLLTSLAVSVGVATAGTVLVAALGGAMLTTAMFPQVYANFHVPVFLQLQVIPVLIMLWVPVFAVTGAVVGASLGVGVSEFLGVIDENPRVLARTVVPPAAGLAVGGLSAAVGASTGLVIFSIWQRHQIRPLGAGCARCETLDASSRSNPPQDSVSQWTVLVPAVVLSTVAGIAALGITQLSLAAVGRAAAE